MATRVQGIFYSMFGYHAVDEVGGGTPYGSSTVAGPDGARWAIENELAIARFQGRHVADVARRLRVGTP